MRTVSWILYVAALAALLFALQEAWEISFDFALHAHMETGVRQSMLIFLQVPFVQLRGEVFSISQNLQAGPTRGCSIWRATPKKDMDNMAWTT
jgi:hypothetical protein